MFDLFFTLAGSESEQTTRTVLFYPRHKMAHLENLFLLSGKFHPNPSSRSTLMRATKITGHPLPPLWPDQTQIIKSKSVGTTLTTNFSHRSLVKLQNQPFP